MEGLSVGDIVFVDFPHSDYSAFKKRPALIVYLTSYGDVVVSQITSQYYDDRDAKPLVQEDFEQGILKRPSVVRLSKLSTIDPAIVLFRIGRLKQDVITAHLSYISKMF